jgi:hypothetical protein
MIVLRSAIIVFPIRLHDDMIVGEELDYHNG